METNTDLSDEKAVAKRKNDTDRIRRKEINDLKAVLSKPEGRRVFWRLLSHCNVYASIFNPNNAIMSKNAGRQDVGHFIQAEIVEADENLYISMMKENKEN